MGTKDNSITGSDSFKELMTSFDRFAECVEKYGFPPGRKTPPTPLDLLIECCRAAGAEDLVKNWEGYRKSLEDKQLIAHSNTEQESAVWKTLAIAMSKLILEQHEKQ